MDRCLPVFVRKGMRRRPQARQDFVGQPVRLTAQIYFLNLYSGVHCYEISRKMKSLIKMHMYIL